MMGRIRKPSSLFLFALVIVLLMNGIEYTYSLNHSVVPNLAVGSYIIAEGNVLFDPAYMSKSPAFGEHFFQTPPVKIILEVVGKESSNILFRLTIKPMYGEESPKSFLMEVSSMLNESMGYLNMSEEIANMYMDIVEDLVDGLVFPVYIGNGSVEVGGIYHPTFLFMDTSILDKIVEEGLSWSYKGVNVSVSVLESLVTEDRIYLSLMIRYSAGVFMMEGSINGIYDRGHNMLTSGIWLRPTYIDKGVLLSIKFDNIVESNLEFDKPTPFSLAHIVYVASSLFGGDWSKLSAIDLVAFTVSMAAVIIGGYYLVKVMRRYARRGF